jgi:hypothetical protein
MVHEKLFVVYTLRWGLEHRLDFKFLVFFELLKEISSF